MQTFVHVSRPFFLFIFTFIKFLRSMCRSTTIYLPTKRCAFSLYSSLPGRDAVCAAWPGQNALSQPSTRNANCFFERFMTSLCLVTVRHEKAVAIPHANTTAAATGYVDGSRSQTLAVEAVEEIDCARAETDTYTHNKKNEKFNFSKKKNDRVAFAFAHVRAQNKAKHARTIQQHITQTRACVLAAKTSIADGVRNARLPNALY